VGGGAHTVTFGTGMQGMGTLALTATGKVRTIHFICTDSYVFELGRTAEFTDTT
jgi:hypothetical protein